MILSTTAHAQTKIISVNELRDKISGAWTGQIIGNIYGLPHENKYVNAPGDESKWPYGCTRNFVDNGKKSLKKEFDLLVRNRNIAGEATKVLSNVSAMNEAVMDSCWYTFGKSMCARTSDVIHDGKLNGSGSVFYSLAAKAKIPNVDYYGYEWSDEQPIDMLVFNTGGMEKLAGGLPHSMLNTKMKKVNGGPLKKLTLTCLCPKRIILFFQPHFVGYVLTFQPVKTKAIRIIGDAVIQYYWNKYTKKVSGFTSITELSVYQSK